MSTLTSFACQTEETDITRATWNEENDWDKGMFECVQMYGSTCVCECAIAAKACMRTHRCV